ncbi:hypothetical protein [Ureibacillus thermophilus]|uniref:Uncharacterized protein n=1 Tax=Ureibacillus thermophilus TaxID=367743 RepID=A0A4V1A3C0_9BACL|nr:hypothetical protein [Ureibacillus thermophilus]QBK26720.1 hypothetical protein DKZ56_13205 [Ureibacillus thermophilus]
MSDKERLENLNPTIVDNQGNVTLKGDDYHWLMELAEKAEKFRKALEFYADESIYSAKNKERAEITLDYGEKARKALEG